MIRSKIYAHIKINLSMLVSLRLGVLLPLIRFSLPGAFTPCGLVPVSFSAGPHRYPIGPGFARALGGVSLVADPLPWACGFRRGAVVDRDPGSTGRGGCLFLAASLFCSSFRLSLCAFIKRQAPPTVKAGGVQPLSLDSLKQSWTVLDFFRFLQPA